MTATVTITGADDAVDVEALVQLSAEFPFVEWGILASRSRQGTARYPSGAWMLQLLVRSLEVPHPLRLSLHLCGAMARAMRAGRAAEALDGLPSAANPVFQRIQINGFDPRSDEVAALAAAGLWLPAGRELILQVRAAVDLEWSASIARQIATTPCSILFDPSGGQGATQDSWPIPPSRCRMGYAGGLGPGNIALHLPDIRAAHARGGAVGPLWVDMESGVRRGDRFDLGAVREVLERAEPAIGKEAAA